MSNPWGKKNPLMSIWLSSVNAAANTVRGAAMARAKRDVASATKNVTSDFVKFWTGASPVATKTRRRKRQR